MRQAIDNLVDHAIRRTPAGGTVTLRAGITGGSAQFVVSDTGPGFVDDLIGPFEFVRHHAIATSAYGSNGLGLAIVRAVAESHGGNLTARSRPAGGAQLVLTLPVGAVGHHDRPRHEDFAS